MSDTDYTTDGLIDRLYTILNKNNLVKTNDKLIIDRPIVAYANRKTTYQNFSSTCKNLNREVLDIKKFFDDEICAKSTIDANGCLIIEGRFRTDNIKKVLMSYLTFYVLCKECSSSNTKLIKEDRIQYLKCSKCMSKKAI